MNTCTNLDSRLSDLIVQQRVTRDWPCFHWLSNAWTLDQSNVFRCPNNKQSHVFLEPLAVRTWTADACQASGCLTTAHSGVTTWSLKRNWITEKRNKQTRDSNVPFKELYMYVQFESSTVLCVFLIYRRPKTYINILDYTFLYSV